MSSDENKEKNKIRIQVDRSLEIDHLTQDLEDARQVIENERAEKENLRATLEEIAQRELSKKLEVVAKQGYDISGIVSEQDSERKIEKLKVAEAELELRKHSSAPQGGETTSFYQNKNEPTKAEREVSEALTKIYLEHGLPIEQIDFPNLEIMRDSLRAIANDTSDKRSAEAKRILSEWLDKGSKRPFELEYQGKITEYGKPSKIRKKGEWKAVSKED